MNKWNKRFMARAREVATWSKHPKHKVGAVIVDSWNRHVSEGFNGPPKGLLDDLEMNKDKLRMRTIHAEINAMVFAQTSLVDCAMYIYPYPPCAQCCALIIQTGIKEVHFLQPNFKNENLSSWKESILEGQSMLREAKIRCAVHTPKTLPGDIVQFKSGALKAGAETGGTLDGEIIWFDPTV